MPFASPGAQRACGVILCEGFAAGAATHFANRKRGFAPSGATSFAPVGKGGKTPLKGEMFRLISPLKIPLSATKKRAAAPFLDHPPGMMENLGTFFWRRWRTTIFPR